MDEAAEAVQIASHVLRMDDQPSDYPAKPGKGKVEVGCGIGCYAALDGRMGYVAFMPERDVLQSRVDGGAYEPCEACHILAEDRVTFVRHCGRAFLAFGEKLLNLQHFGALQVAYFSR